jgi:hypothetical protein
MAIVIGAVLRIDVMGWSGDPPGLPHAPIRVEEGRGGVQSFYYDFSPKTADLDVPQMADRLGPRLMRALLSEKSPFADKPVAARTVLDIGVMVAADKTAYSYTWPVEFLQTLADAEIELAVSHYVTNETGESGQSDLIIED